MEVGYDKVKIWIDRAIVGDNHPTIANYLDRAKQETDLQTGEVKTTGCIEGLKVSVFASGLYIVGSLPKFIFGSNVYPLDRHKAVQAIEKISDTLHIQVKEGVVTSLEFGANYLMKNPVPDYLLRLGSMQRLERVQLSHNSIRYEGRGKKQPRVFAFYDKIADAAAKGMECPNGLENLLRFEIRLNGRLPYQLSVPEVKASTLTDMQFYRMMVEYYINSYFSISKLNQIKTDVMSEIRTPKDAFDVFVARLISQTDQNQINGFLDELKRAGVFVDRKNYSRLKNKILEVATKANITIADELIKELDDEVKNSGAYV
ncbi:MAG: hypothetical protein K6F22_11345 [Prevotella sp.]|nr:hypothetical protein [Prevotella sp.]